MSNASLGSVQTETATPSAWMASRCRARLPSPNPNFMAHAAGNRIPFVPFPCLSAMRVASPAAVAARRRESASPLTSGKSAARTRIDCAPPRRATSRAASRAAFNPEAPLSCKVNAPHCLPICRASASALATMQRDRSPSQPAMASNARNSNVVFSARRSAGSSNSASRVFPEARPRAGTMVQWLIALKTGAGGARQRPPRPGATSPGSS